MALLPLFRPAALAAQRHETLGTVSLASPVSFAVLSGLFGALAIGLGAFAWLGEYTAHQTLSGRVVPMGGIVDVTSPQSGSLIEKHVTVGQSVAVGEPLYVISAERNSLGYGPTQVAIGELLERRRASLVRQVDSTRELENGEREALANRLAALERERHTLDTARDAQRERVALAVAAAQRYGHLRALGHLAEEQSAQKEAELLEQRARLTALERDLAALARLRAELEGRVATLEPQYVTQLAELEGSLAAIELEIAENEARRAVVVAAPQAGVATAVGGELGQAVEPGEWLLSLVPQSARLVAELYAPSRAVGFIARGDAVRLRHAAFPYQKFGHAHGTVLEVSATPLGAVGAGATSAPRGEPLYRIVVALDSATVLAHGVARPLLAGMSVEADVLLETRRLYEWLFEPLFAMARRLEG
jgi:membrane fusion protein